MANEIPKNQMVKKWCVYKHTSPNGKVYIGITSQNPLKRWRNGKGYRDNDYFFRAITKYGWDNFTHEIVKSDLSKEEACRIEVNLIQKYQSNNPEFGYNNSLGGEVSALGCHYSRPKGELSPKFGTYHSDESKEKISRNRKGKMMGAANHKSKAVLCVELDAVFDSLGDAERTLSICRKYIWRACNRPNGTSGGYHWRWVNAV
jgi:hypothetical protein